MFCHKFTSAFCLVLLCTAAGQPVVGQERSFHSSNPPQAWKTSDEITMSGVIQQVLTQPPEGGPLGFNFVMTASQKPLTVNAGPMLTDKVREQLRAGQSIEVTGLTRTINGQSYLLAREMVVGGQIIQPRNKNGFLVHSLADPNRPAARSKRVENNLQGGAR
ncbi:MAG TPA: hypothetical protein VK593_08640 [Edaphobacter sp.]|nr:hypothetical protein [Edaphobacter sp.]